jgi:hypothetical protein
VAPRLGGAWDVLNNGKLKAFASFGYFYDIMKLGLPRGSFGGDYWHDCVYTLDDPDYTKIVPAVTSNHFCPTSGPASGSTTGQFIENVNFRSVILDPTDPGVDPNLKPMKQHESTVVLIGLSHQVSDWRHAIRASAWTWPDDYWT